MSDERTPIEDMKEALEDLRDHDGETVMIYMPKDAYDRLTPEMIANREATYHCKIVPVSDEEMKRIKDDAVPYTMPPDLTKLPDIKMPQLAMYDVPHVKGGRYHEPPRDLKKKKKAKRRQQKQSRRRR